MDIHDRLSSFKRASQLSAVFDGHETWEVMSGNKPAVGRANLVSAILAGLPYLTLLGFSGIVANVALGFEEPHRGLLYVSVVLLAAAPLGMAVHMAFTHELDAEDKRAWVTGLISLTKPWLFGAYFTSRGRREATERLRANRQSAECGDR